MSFKPVILSISKRFIFGAFREDIVCGRREELLDMRISLRFSQTAGLLKEKKRSELQSEICKRSRDGVSMVRRSVCEKPSIQSRRREDEDSTTSVFEGSFFALLRNAVVMRAVGVGWDGLWTMSWRSVKAFAEEDIAVMRSEVVVLRAMSES